MLRISLFGRKRRRETPRWAFVVGSIFLIVALAFVIRAFMLRSEEKSALDWPKAEGVIGSCEVKHLEKKGRRQGARWLVSLEYSYTVDARQHTGKRLRLDSNRFHKESGARAAAEEYAPGTRVWVYYDPTRPGEGVLQPGVTPNTEGMFYFSAAAAGCGAVFVARGVYLLRKGWR